MPSQGENTKSSNFLLNSLSTRDSLTAYILWLSPPSVTTPTLGMPLFETWPRTTGKDFQRVCYQITFSYTFNGSFLVERIKSRGTETTACVLQPCWLQTGKLTWTLPSQPHSRAGAPSLSPSGEPPARLSLCRSTVQAPPGLGQLSSAWLPLLPGGPPIPPSTRQRGSFTESTCHSANLTFGLLQPDHCPPLRLHLLPSKPALFLAHGTAGLQMCPFTPPPL